MRNILVLFLIMLGQTVWSQPDITQIFQFAKENKTKPIKDFLKTGGNVNTVNGKNNTMLILACYNDAFEVVELLLNYNARTDLQDFSGNTALMGAAYRGNLPIVKLLLEKGADPNQLNYNQTNALFLAVTFKHLEIAKLLITYKTDLTHKDQEGKTVLDHAMAQGNQEMIDLLSAK